MGQREDLQTKLEGILGTAHVYFQPPANVVLTYPCIVYKRDSAIIEHADNAPHRNLKAYLVTVIDPNPDSSIPDKIAKLPTCYYNRFYTADNLNHDVFKLFF